MQFTDEIIEQLFGAEDAEGEEEERFRQYFVKNKAYDSVNSSLPIRILVGHKGVGKSALLRRAHLKDLDNNQLSVWIQHNDITSVPDFDAKSLNEKIEHWKLRLIDIISIKLTEQLFGSEIQLGNNNDPKKITGLIGFIKTIAQSKTIEQTQKAIYKNFLEEEIIRVYIDDIDRGWSGSESDIQNLSAMINAIRDLANQDRRVKFRIGIRTDVYYLYRTSDESTDKIERHVIWLNWNRHEILSVVAYRIATFFDSNTSQDKILKLEQEQITSEILSKVMQPKFSGRGHWHNRHIHHVLLSLNRNRPRDLIKLLHSAARNAAIRNSDLISSNDVQDSFQSYSEERMQDLINEFKSEMPNIKSLLFGFRPTKKMQKTSESFQFTNDGIIRQIKTISDQSNLYFTRNSSASPKSIQKFLYKIDFITARRKLDSGYIDRKFFDQSRFLSDEEVDFGYSWEVHPAYRWALQPHDIQSVIDTLD